MVGIILNSAAEIGQVNLTNANTAVEKSIARLSSGNRITAAQDDVSGLAVGTTLQTNVSTMRSALTNAAQATALLGVADGALENITQILQRNKALSVQTNSGALDDIARGFLDLEFQNNTDELNRISTTTNFNNTKLLDGSLYSPSKITTDSTNKLTSQSMSSSIDFLTSMASGQTIQLFSSETTSPSGYSRQLADGAFIATPFTSRPSGSGSSYPLNLLEFDGTVSAASAATNFLNMTKNLLEFTGSDETVLRAKKIVSAFNFIQNGTSLQVTAKSSGSYWNMIDIVTPSNGSTLAINGITISTGSSNVSLSSNTLVQGVNGSLPAGGFSYGGSGSAGATSYSNDINRPGLVPSTYAQGSIKDSLLVPLTPTQSWTTGLNLSGISNNPAFTGKLPQISVRFAETNTVNLEVTVGNVTYYANNVNTNPSVNAEVVFYAADSGYGSFSMQVAAGNGLQVLEASDASIYQNRINTALSGIDIYQRRELTNFNGSGLVLPTGSLIASGDLSASKFWLINDDFLDFEVASISVSSPINSNANAIITITASNGDIYQSGYDYDGSVNNLANFSTPNTFTNDGGINLDGKYGFVNQNDPNKILIMQYSSATPLSITSPGEAAGLQLALETAFNIGNGSSGGGLKFQIGSATTDIIGVQIEGATAQNLYKDSNNTYVALNIKTIENASQASSILDGAIQKVISIRATIGSMQKRFDFASANISSSIQNLDAARSIFLDTDVSVESTLLAQSQVKLQASVSVLAQANQIPTILLKLIG